MSAASDERTQAVLREMLRQDGGCRAVAIDPPSDEHGRGLFFKHEFPVRHLRRLFGIKTPCYCGDMLG